MNFLYHHFGKILLLLIFFSIILLFIFLWGEVEARSYVLVTPCDDCIFTDVSFEAPEHLKVKKGMKGYFRDYCQALSSKCK